MKRHTHYLAVILALAAFVIGGSGYSVADAGVFTGNGQSIHQISSHSVQLGSIDVTIALGRGRFLFDGTVPGMDAADYECVFRLKNLTSKPVDIQVGFPIDSEFAGQQKVVTPKDSEEWVLGYSFIARDEATTYHVSFVKREGKLGPGQFRSLFVWKMHFVPGETRTLTVKYTIPISMGLVSLSKDERKAKLLPFNAQTVLDIGM
ncbi:MAG TPA: hypothetical protein VLA96_03515, partial [Terriglobales bacterium]|nr:hypothetical protein [Terriglobales bacterium]